MPASLDRERCAATLREFSPGAVRRDIENVRQSPCLSELASPRHRGDEDEDDAVNRATMDRADLLTRVHR